MPGNESNNEDEQPSLSTEHTVLSLHVGLDNLVSDVIRRIQQCRSSNGVNR